MLAIRMQRLGRKALPIYRLAVQESRRHPSSGRVVAYVGNYNPHTKVAKLDTEKLTFYLKNGARPTPRVTKLLKEEKITLPDWVKGVSEKKRGPKHPEKLRKNQPKNADASEVNTVETAETTDSA